MLGLSVQLLKDSSEKFVYKVVLYLLLLRSKEAQLTISMSVCECVCVCETERVPLSLLGVHLLGFSCSVLLGRGAEQGDKDMGRLMTLACAHGTALGFRFPCTGGSALQVFSMALLLFCDFF